MTRRGRIAFIGNSLPRRCGIATFTTDLQQAVQRSDPASETAIVAMTDNGQTYDYPSSVIAEIRDDVIEDYVRAAEILNAGHFDIVSLQHEFGIFGGEAGSHILELLSRLTVPVVTTLHTILSKPTPLQRAVLGKIIEASSKIIVMAEKGRELLRTVYDVPNAKIEVVAHGIPEFAFVEPDNAKAKLGFSDKSVILTFGLLSPNKGIEFVIDAMPEILRRQPNAIYVILGATHPNLVRHEGEAYRESLVSRIGKLGITDHVALIDRFVDQATLLDFISMCDVYVTPYLQEAQMTSGTLAYSFGLGKAVVSTPYWHASELLAEGRGVLVPFGDSMAIGNEVADLLTNEVRREAMRRRAYASSRSMTWRRTAERYRLIFEDTWRGHQLHRLALAPKHQAASPVAVFSNSIAMRTRPRAFEGRLNISLASVGGGFRPARAALIMRTAHFLSMCDDTGLFQHAVHCVPDRLHGYCVDDNARALLVACALNGKGEEPLPEALTMRFASFVQHAWNPDTRRFRNFMSFDRRWLEPSGSEDSHGRTLWALGECSRSDRSPSRRRWAAALFTNALPVVEAFSSPRAWAFTLLGLAAYRVAIPEDHLAKVLQNRLADRLLVLLSAVSQNNWVWFEDGLAYDNARLPQALLLTGASTGVPAYVAAGLSTLTWLMALQTAPKGFFRPVGSHGFGEKRALPKPFDQQPLEATAAISACLAAWRATGEGNWRALAESAFAWFLGENDLSLPLVDQDTGSCRDGLHPDRANENRGGESVVSYLLSLAEIRQLAQIGGDAARSPVLHIIGV